MHGVISYNRSSFSLSGRLCCGLLFLLVSGSVCSFGSVWSFGSITSRGSSSALSLLTFRSGFSVSSDFSSSVLDNVLILSLLVLPEYKMGGTSKWGGRLIQWVRVIERDTFVPRRWWSSRSIASWRLTPRVFYQTGIEGGFSHGCWRPWCRCEVGMWNPCGLRLRPLEEGIGKRLSFQIVGFGPFVMINIRKYYLIN